MTISKMLVEQLGGLLILKSEPGAGSKFTFEIELVQADRMPSSDQVIGCESDVEEDYFESPLSCQNCNELQIKFFPVFATTGAVWVTYPLHP